MLECLIDTKGNFTLHALKTYRFTETEEDHLLNSINELVELDLVKVLNTDQGKESWTITTNPFVDTSNR